MASSGFTERIFCLLLLASVGEGAAEASGEGGLGSGCTRLSDTSYTRLHQTGQAITLTCPKQCSNDTPIWYHTLGNNTAVSEIDHGLELVLSFTKPPTPNNIGYFCCACAGEHPKVNSCCFGVGYSPEVYTFQTGNEQTEVKGLYVGQSVEMRCVVFGYPGKDTNAEIVGPGNIEMCQSKHFLYKAVCEVEIPHVTVGHSGFYTCRGVLTITQAGETGRERSDNILRKKLVVYKPPRVTDLRQEDSADDESVTFVCTVECSIDFHITWLHNGTRLNITEDGKYQSFNSGSSQHKLRVLLTSTSDVGGYTCVLNTAFKRNESVKTIGLRSTPQALSNIEDLPGPLKEQEWSSKVITVIVVLTVSFSTVIIIAVIYIAWILKKRVYQACREVTGHQKRGDKIPLQESQNLEAGEHDSLSDEDTDGPSRPREEAIERREIYRSLEVIKGPTAVRLRRQALQSS